IAVACIKARRRGLGRPARRPPSSRGSALLSAAESQTRARRGNGTPAGDQLVARRVQSARRIAEKDIVEQRRYLTRVAVAHAVDFDAGARAAGSIETRDPGCYGF